MIVKKSRDDFNGPQVRHVTRPKIEGESRARREKSGHTRNTPTNPTGCKPATTKQQIARMIPANEGKYAPTTTHQLTSQNPHDAHVHRVPSEELVNQSRNKDLPDGVVKTMTPIAMATTYTSVQAIISMEWEDLHPVQVISSISQS
jgi:hypothetical protein